MDRLPPELFGLIADQCTHSSLKTLRLVNRDYSEAVTPRVFEHFYMGILDESHDKLAAISKSKLAKHVKSFTFLLDRLPDWMFEDWERWINYKAEIEYWKASIQGRQSLLRSRPGWVPAELPFDLPDATVAHGSLTLRHYLSDRQLHDGWKAFESLRQQQREWHESRHGIVLKECLAMLPNLEAVECTPAFQHRWDYYRSTWPLWTRIRHQMLVSLEDWAAARRDFPRHIPFLVLEALAYRASFSGTKPVTRLKLESLHNEPYGPATALDGPDLSRRFARICEGLWCLTHIDWNVIMFPKHENDCSSLAKESLLLLSGAKHVKSLSLSFNDYDSYHSSKTGLGDAHIDSILESEPSWPCLEHLRLSLSTSHTKLLQLFDFLSPSLRSLELLHMHVGDAGQLIAQMPKILKLDDIHLSRVWYNRQMLGPRCLFPAGKKRNSKLERAIRSYLLRQSNVCPDL